MVINSLFIFLRITTIMRKKWHCFCEDTWFRRHYSDPKIETGLAWGSLSKGLKAQNKIHLKRSILFGFKLKRSLGGAARNHQQITTEPKNRVAYGWYQTSEGPRPRHTHLAEAPHDMSWRRRFQTGTCKRWRSRKLWADTAGVGH